MSRFFVSAELARVVGVPSGSVGMAIKGGMLFSRRRGRLFPFEKLVFKELLELNLLGEDELFFEELELRLICLGDNSHCMVSSIRRGDRAAITVSFDHKGLECSVGFFLD